MILAFKDIPGYEGFYQVSNTGIVKSLSRIVLRKEKGPQHVKERILKPGTNTRGYLYVILCKNGKHKNFHIHQLVAMAFLKYVPDGTTKLVVDHINNIKTDNRLENLQLITHRENITKDRIGCLSKYTGVSWDNKNKKWKTRIQVNGKIKYLGLFDNELDAHKSYQKYLKQIKS